MTHDLELKPCPFCGVSLERSEVFSSRTSDSYFHPESHEQCPAQNVLIHGPSSASKWNSRAALSHEGEANVEDFEKEVRQREDEFARKMGALETRAELAEKRLAEADAKFGDAISVLEDIGNRHSGMHIPKGKGDPFSASSMRHAARAFLAAAEWMESEARATDCEDETDRKLQTVVAPDNGTVPEVMAAILECARAWVPEARIIGNVRAGDIARAVESALSAPKAEVRGGTLNLHLGSNNTVDCGGADISDPLHGKKITIRDANASPAPALTAGVAAEPVEPVAYLVHNFMVARQPVKAQGKFPEPDHYLYPASRKDDAEATAKTLRADCDPLYTSPAPTITDEAVERAAEAIAGAWGETWACCCTEQRGLDCDCGDAMCEDREGRPYDEDLTREDCRMAARAALTAAFPSTAAVGDAVERAAVSDQIIGQIEDRFPNWRSYRDLLDCIDCTMAELRRDVR
ncbi:hypothetical protein GN330_22950 [Nitratireductor sp. CAU 1489]|uniref:Uncharacterized protein n=1 Tax=Nitratireductor arenosus TaxID=2682096 RepID=A0A844QPY9_9HYPH|nr:hypothetical protein [Nitratireductor arenosus]MVB00109.1 hypothetical protein [Nitratireductor arenosus]